jgi:hypothetical protein
LAGVARAALASTHRQWARSRGTIRLFKPYATRKVATANNCEMRSAGRVSAWRGHGFTEVDN